MTTVASLVEGIVLVGVLIVLVIVTEAVVTAVGT